MGNSSSRDARTPPGQGLDHGRADSDTVHAVPNPADRVYSSRNGVGRVSRHDLPFLSMGRDRDGDHPAPERPRETKQEREARRAERDRQARLKERERSMREESVDGGFLVTLGTYTGPEDFNKGIVRQLQIERRLAPFWKGLNDHSASWTEAQLVAAARGLPIPAADEVPPEMARTGSQTSSIPSASGANVQGLTIPVGSRSQSYQTDASANLSASHPAFSSSSNPSSPTAKDYSSSPLFRGRAKTLASLAAGHKNPSSDLAPQEIRLPNDPLVNGQPLEAVLYKDADECPICFMYYPPFLNHTRCCDQPICSECFVQIKRPDPHPPEHEQPGQPRPPEEEAECLVSEVAACPFCVTPEFGVTYEPPSFRRGLAYANHAHGQPFRNPTSATSSNTSLPLGAGRRRATSLSANSSQVITTDRVRPDWAKKLADARAHVLRRAAAATALHNAAYVLGSQGDGQLRAGFNFSRRRRLVNADTTTGGSVSREGEADGDLFSNRTSSRRPRMEDLEEIMMLEAIRLSLAAEEERKRKEEKEAKKKAKKDEKEAKKEEKRAEKLSKRHGSSGSLHSAGADEHTGAWGMARSSSNLGTPPTIPEEQVHGKGKQPVQDFAGFNPLLEPTSTLNDRDFGSKKSSSPTDDPQRHLEASRANIQPASSVPISTPTRAPHLRQFSDASSVASSFESAPSSFKGDSSSHIMIPGGPDSIAGAQQDTTGTPRSGTPPVVESMFNFQSLAAMIGEETEKSGGPEHIEHAPASADRLSTADGEVTKFSPNNSPRIAPVSAPTDVTNQTRGKDTTHKSKGKDLGEVSIIDQGQTAG